MGQNNARYAGILVVAAILSILVFSIYAPGVNAARGRIENNSTQSGLVGTHASNATVQETTTIPVTVPVPGTGMAFQNGVLVKFASTAAANCTSSIKTLYNNYPQAVNASSTTNCEIGIGISNTTGMSPLYMISPSFAGLSIYGQVGWNSTAQGYPTFNKTVIVTACGASTSVSNCSATSLTKYFYSPGVSTFEMLLGDKSGLFGLPEGVMAKPAHDLIVPAGINSKTPTETYLVRVGVFDPNIFPNSTTGMCKQWVASNLTNPTANCLNNIAALARALNTTDTAVTNANKNNILFTSKNIPPYQASLTIYTIVNGTAVATNTKNVNQSNTNVVKWLMLAGAVTTTQPTTTIVATTAQPTSTVAVNQTVSPATGSSNTLLYVGVVIVIIVIIVALWLVMKRKK